MKAFNTNPLCPHDTRFWGQNLGSFLPPRAAIAPEWLVNTIMAHPHALGKINLSTADGESADVHSIDRETIHAMVQDGYTRVSASSDDATHAMTKLTVKTKDGQWSFEGPIELPTLPPQTWIDMYSRDELQERYPVIHAALSTFQKLLRHAEENINIKYYSLVLLSGTEQGAKITSSKTAVLNSPLVHWERYVPDFESLTSSLEQIVYTAVIAKSPEMGPYPEGIFPTSNSFRDKGFILDIERGDRRILTLNLTSKWG